MRASGVSGWIAVALLAGCASTPQTEQAPKPSLTFDLFIDVVPPATETWHLTYDGGDRLAISISWGASSGDLEGGKDVSETFQSEMRDVILAQRFFELPSHLSPRMVAIHSQDAFLTITLDGREHRVMVSDPKSQAGDERYARFKAIFDAILSRLPVKPRWE